MGGNRNRFIQNKGDIISLAVTVWMSPGASAVALPPAASEDMLCMDQSMQE